MVLRKGLHVDSQSTCMQATQDIALSVIFLLHTCTVTKTRVEVLLATYIECCIVRQRLKYTDTCTVLPRLYGKVLPRLYGK